jgi:DNA-binding transcriptional ArsR family regulator
MEMQTITLEMVSYRMEKQTIALEMVSCRMEMQTITLEMVSYRMEMQSIAQEMVLECVPMTAPIQANIDPVTVFAALGSPIRWRLMKMMANGKMLSASQASDALGRHQLDSLIKHLQVLRDAGLVNSKRNEQDRRSQLYYIPEVWRTEPDVLDFGFCILDLSVTPR